MAGIPDDKLQEVRDRVDIVDLVRRHVELRKAGRNFKGLCPFHSEKSPSFNVNPDRKGYKCFGCGAGGDAIGFVMELEGKSFPEAVRKLADLYGISLPQGGSRTGQTDDSTEKDQAYALMKLASERYAEVLRTAPEGQAGRAYVAARGLEEHTVRTFSLGYAPAPSEAGWDFLVRAIEHSALSLSLAERLGLLGRSERSGRYYDLFRGRLMFPVITPGGETVAFSGRVVPPHDADGERTPPKYINSPESPLYRKGKTLFGLPQARKPIAERKRIVLVEGNVDVLKLHQWGLGEAVAPLGTAFTSEQAQALGRFADQVVMCFDGDAAGKKAAFAALPRLLEVDLDVRMVVLPEGEDPDSLGQQRLLALVEGAEPALELLMVRMAARAGSSMQQRARSLDRLVPLIARVPRETARTLYVERAAELFGFAPVKLASQVRATRGAPTERAAQVGGEDRAPRKNSRDNRPLPSTSGRAVPLSAPPNGSRAGGHGSAPPPHDSNGSDRADASPRSQRRPLPRAQAQLTMLLVDLPHLASAAQRYDALAAISDDRLAPIAAAVVDGATRGENPTMTELLELAPPEEQARIYDTVFAGRFRADQAGAGTDPQAILQTLVHRCQEQALDQQIRDLEREIHRARTSGNNERVLELAQRRLGLRRTQAELRNSPPPGPPAASRPRSLR